MKKTAPHAAKALYQVLRSRPWAELWGERVPEFNAAGSEERATGVALIRAIGVVFAEGAPESDGPAVRAWLRGLLIDPDPRIRRYAAAALPKTGAAAEDEAALLAALRRGGREERPGLLGALAKIGTAFGLQNAAASAPEIEQRARAAVARAEQPGQILMDRAFAGRPNDAPWEIRLQCRKGLEEIVGSEVEAAGIWQILGQKKGEVRMAPTGPFSLGDVMKLRCYSTFGLVAGRASGEPEQLARLLADGRTRKLLRAFTEGPVRYRIEFVSKGHQRALVRAVAEAVFQFAPELLNDPRRALWAAEFHPDKEEETLEIRPRFSPDPRFAYRRAAVPAASHPPLAACMVRVAGPMREALVWDPFCGSGVELIEAAKAGGTRQCVGTDLNPEAIEGARVNAEAAGLERRHLHFEALDFREHPRLPWVTPGSVDRIITNPPMGRRVPVAGLRALIDALFRVAAIVLKPGGRLVFTNPVRTQAVPAALRLLEERAVDMGGFSARLACYEKIGSPPLPPQRGREKAGPEPETPRVSPKTPRVSPKTPRVSPKTPRVSPDRAGNGRRRKAAPWEW